MKLNLRKMFYYLFVAGVGSLFVFFLIGLGFRYTRKDEPLRLGVSFSVKQARNFELDPKGTLNELIDAGFTNFRLMSYWDIHEQSKDEYDFSELDWQFDLIESTGGTVTLAIGQRQPRWPECHIPGWALNSDKEEYELQLIQYLEETVTRYKDRQSLISFQLENEAANNKFGVCEKYDRDLLQRELNAVRIAAPDSEIITNLSNQSGVPLTGAVGDRVGFSYYRTANFSLLGKNIQWSFWYLPTWWHGFRAEVVRRVHGTEPFIHEMQAEPWGSHNVWDQSSETQTSIMPVENIENYLADARRTGMSEIYVWGGEWYVWRQKNFNDSTYLDYFSLVNQRLNR